MGTTTHWVFMICGNLSPSSSSADLLGGQHLLIVIFSVKQNCHCIYFWVEFVA
jgi:hypothetical protein